MEITVGTFNLNNLFSRYNFKAEIKTLKKKDATVASNITYEFSGPEAYRIRTFKGRLVKPKDAKESQAVAARILAMDCDVLAVQEVENIDILKQFNRENLGGLYPYQVLIEGNDPRLIDLGLLSKLPIGAITSWQTAVHPDEPGQTVFGRDLLQVEVMNATRSKKLFTVFNNHLKSNFVPYGEDQEEGHRRANERRKRQAETVAKIVEARTRPNSRFIVLGDMNDSLNSNWLKPLVKAQGLGLVNALKQPQETRLAKADNPPPNTTAWTHRFKPTGQPAEYELYDQIWLSPALAGKQTGAWIDRRTKHGGDGSDHDPAWVVLEL